MQAVMTGQNEGHRDLIRRHRHESRERTRKIWKGRGHVFTGQVQFELTTYELDIRVHTKGNNRPEGQPYLRLVGPISDPGRFKGTWIELEVLENQGKYGFLMRLVRRGFLKTGGAADLAEFVFKMTGDAPNFCRNDVSLGRSVDPRLKKRFTPGKFQSLFSLARTCTLVLGGEPVFVTRLFHQGRVTPVGEHCPPDLRKPVEKEVLDIN